MMDSRDDRPGDELLQLGGNSEPDCGRILAKEGNSLKSGIHSLFRSGRLVGYDPSSAVVDCLFGLRGLVYNPRLILVKCI